jgi:cytochrome o ubiquinol oxidase subunit 2
MTVTALPNLIAAGPAGMVVMHPAGDIALQQRDLIILATVLMLLIVVPVIAMTLWFAWRYRASNLKADYRPDWRHSTRIETAVWTAPLLIILALGVITWRTTHLLDPYRPLARLAPGEAVPAGVKPLEVDVVALDWKWLFLYPDLGVATVNELAAPVNTPIDFRITADSVMNSFSVPALAGQVYAMPGMQTQLHAVFNRPGEFEGFSANYSGAGFSGMRFAVHGLSAADFQRWAAAARAGGATLDRTTYLALEQPSQDEPARRYAAVSPDLFQAILNRCVESGKMCADDMARIDAQGGLGLAGAHDVMALEYDKDGRRGGEAPPERFVAAVCAPRPPGKTPAAPPSAHTGALALIRSAVPAP